MQEQHKPFFSFKDVDIIVINYPPKAHVPHEIIKSLISLSQI